MQRMMLSVVLAFLVGALLGKLLLPVLYKLKFGQNIYELAPEAHKKKQGTPIMGGLAFAGAAILIGFLVVFGESPCYNGCSKKTNSGHGTAAV